jgi:hypothetical protein
MTSALNAFAAPAVLCFVLTVVHDVVRSRR